jgi:polysaccharide export outer membrane protein
MVFAALRSVLILCVMTGLYALEGEQPPQGYRLLPGDLLHIAVFDHEDLTAQIRVPVNGVISYPLIGAMDGVVGAGLDNFIGRLQDRLEDGYIRQAVITVTVLEFGPRRAVVMGSVERPDAVQLSPYAPTTAMQAIGQVGGFLDDANRAGAIVIRDDPNDAGRKLALAVPAADDAQAMMSDVVLEPRDIVIVPRLDRVYIIGQVRRPGAVNLPSLEALTVSKAISLAGGFEKFARESDVLLIRSVGEMQTVDVRAILSGKEGVVDLKLKPGDTVYVPESRF